MSRVNVWWPMYPADFAADTSHLSNELIGVYLKLLNAIWRNDGAIRNDPQYLARLAGVKPNRWRSVFAEIADKFEVVDGFLTAKIHQDAMARALSNREKKRAAADARWAAERHAAALQVHSSRIAGASGRPMHMQCPSSSSSSSSVLPAVMGLSGLSVLPQNGAEVEP